MRIAGLLDFGGSHPFPAPVGAQLMGSAVVEGSEEVIFPRGGKRLSQQVTFWAKDWLGRGGQAANSPAALRYLLAQTLELVRNPRLNPTLIEWRTTGDGSYSASDEHDGWYLIESFEPLYKTIVAGIVQVRMKVSHLGPSTAPQAIWYAGGSLPTNYSGAAQTAIGLPGNAQASPGTLVNRAGAEGGYLLALAPPAATNPLPLAPSATLTDWFKYGCRVYDTLTVGGNAVPTGGTFTHASWVEVKHRAHRFEGDCIVTNGLHLYRFQIGVAGQVGTCYLWSTAQSTPGWLQFATLVYNDNAAASGTLRSFSLQAVGLEEVRLVTDSSTGSANWTEISFRLQRGQYFARVDLKPLTQAAASSTALQLTLPANVKILYNGGKIGDPGGSENPVVQTDYGYGAAFIPNAAYPFITGWLYQNQSGSLQPSSSGGSVVFTGDNASLAQNAIRSYGLFAHPYGNSTDTTQRLQAAAATLTLAGGFVSAADAGTVSTNAAKAPSGSSGATCQGPTFTPQAGAHDLWIRARVASVASGVAQMRLELFDSTSGSVAGQFTDFAPSALATTYAWYRAATNFIPNPAHTQIFRAATVATTTTDFFIDEFALVPRTLSAANTGPQELWQQFLHGRDARWLKVAV